MAMDQCVLDKALKLTRFDESVEAGATRARLTQAKKDIRDGVCTKRTKDAIKEAKAVLERIAPMPGELG